MDTRIFDAHAASVVDLHERIGSGRNADFAQLVQAAHQWQSVDPSNTEERALAFTYHSCRNMRAEAAENGLAVDMPHRYYELAGGSVGRSATHFLYETCRRAKYEIFTDVGRSIHSFGYQVKACAENKVQCKKDKIQCMSTCGGGDGSQYKHDFATIVSSTELSRFALEGGFYTQAAADCNVRSYVFKVPAFSGGESFATFAARMRTRSKQLQFQTSTHTRAHMHTHTRTFPGGMTAINTKFCSDNPLSCGAIQNVLEKAPGLVFVNGEFRHKYSLVPPSPPPLPLPPPRIFAYASEPPSPPPPPGTPPPYYGVRKNATRINTPHTLDSPNIWPNTTKCNQSTQPSSGRRAMHTAAAPGGLRPEHYDRIRQRSRDRGARKLCICSEDSGCKTARERLFRPHCLSKSSVRIAHSNHKPVTYIHAHTPLTPT